MLVPYSPTWPLVFERLRQELLPLFTGVPIEIAYIDRIEVEDALKMAGQTEA